MQNTLQQENLRVLKAQYPDFHHALTSKEFSNPDMKLSEIPGTDNFLVQSGDINCNLHSSYSVDREMQQLFKPLPNEDNQVILIFGLGNAHCLDYIKKMRIKYKKVIIFEPYNNVLIEVLKKRTLQDVFGRPNIFIHIFKLPNEMAQDLFREALGSKTVKILFHVSYMTLYKELYDDVIRTFRNEKNSVNTSISTFHYFSTEWNKNQIKSLKRKDPSLSPLVGKFKGVPGIIASAGPSLEKQFDLLRQVGDKAVIVSPGTASKIMNRQNIDSHFAMSIDSQVQQSLFYKDFHLNSILVGSYRLHPDVCINFPNRITRVALNSEFLALYYNKWIQEDFVEISDHASVASSAVDLLVALGCNPIILIGQDLCYTERKRYADDKADSLSAKLQLQTFEDTDIYGNKVFTTSGFKAMQTDMENLNIRYQSDVTIYNATEGGLNIPGIENVAFRKIFESTIQDRPSSVRETIDSVLKSLPESTLESGDKKLTDFYAHVLDECKQTDAILLEKKDSYQRLNKLKARNMTRTRLNNEMAYIQSHNKRMEERDFFKKVLFPNIQQQLTFYKASANHISDDSEDYEGAEQYEHKLDEYLSDFSNRLKILILEEMAQPNE